MSSQSRRKLQTRAPHFRGMFKSHGTKSLTVDSFEYDFAFAVHLEIVSDKSIRAFQKLLTYAICQVRTTFFNPPREQNMKHSILKVPKVEVNSG